MAPTHEMYRMPSGTDMLDGAPGDGCPQNGFVAFKLKSINGGSL
jgi:hypothetical protein